MRKLILSAAMAATALTGIAAPITASAQSRPEWREDRREDRREERRDDRRDVRDAHRDLREERGELREARREGDRRDIREERRDVIRAENRYSRELRDYRRDNPRLYSRGNWRAPYAYRHWDRGVRIERAYYAPRYYVNDPWRYRLPVGPGYARWVRHYDDVLLIDLRSGRVIDVYYNFFF